MFEWLKKLGWKAMSSERLVDSSLNALLQDYSPKAAYLVEFQTPPLEFRLLRLVTASDRPTPAACKRVYFYMNLPIIKNRQMCDLFSVTLDQQIRRIPTTESSRSWVRDGVPRFSGCTVSETPDHLRQDLTRWGQAAQQFVEKYPSYALQYKGDPLQVIMPHVEILS